MGAGECGGCGAVHAARVAGAVDHVAAAVRHLDGVVPLVLLHRLPLPGASACLPIGMPISLPYQAPELVCRRSLLESVT